MKRFPLRSRIFSQLKKVPVKGWLLIGVSIVAAVFLLSAFLVRRQVVEFRQEHQFGVADPEFWGSAHALADPVLLPGNKIELLNNGDGIFPPMLAAIRAAKATVNFEAFLFNSGEVGSQFRDAFCDRARAGVKVRVLLDGVGSGSKLDDGDVKAMQEAGCEVHYYHPTRSWRVDKSNRRTHRRVLVVDGKVGFTGGVGFADEWLGNADAPRHWRDIHARIEGPLVAKLQGAFQQHWAKETRQPLGGPGDFPAIAEAGSLRAQLVASHSFSFAPLPLVQAVAIASAERNVWIANAYCWPSEDQVDLLIKAVKRGVDVRLLVPGTHNDQPATKAGGRNAYGDLLRGGVKIFEYQPTMLHSKTMVVDGLFSMFGSSNLDSRSTQINEELDITVYDEGFGQEMERLFSEDLKQSHSYTLEEYNRRSLWERVTEWLVIPFRSQL